jgi:hypothetical protein
MSHLRSLCNFSGCPMCNDRGCRHWTVDWRNFCYTGEELYAFVNSAGTGTTFIPASAGNSADPG